ncbi:MAG: hypothetical protein BWZ07_00957 [Alphaproteobacteria bacterium ADurb.BinA280]|nr:MAG: hypothetical protein BWZ07_00957 [Alphaproteobacteria bacterium ADurb.BinA280]
MADFEEYIKDEIKPTLAVVRLDHGSGYDLGGLSRRQAFLALFDHGFDVFGVDAGGEGIVGTDGMIQQGLRNRIETRQRVVKELLDERSHGRQNRSEIGSQQAEHVDRQRTDIVQFGARARLRHGPRGFAGD